MAIFLVRHAHAAWTPEENRSLSARGRQDAQRVADLLSDPARVPSPISAVYAGTARRAQQTVTPLAARLGLPLQIAPALDERRLSARPVPDFEAAVRATWADFNLVHPGGESNAAAQARGLALVRGLSAKDPDAQVVLGTHGNLLALIVHGFLPAYGYLFWQSLTMPDVYRLELQIESGSASALALERLWSS